jgi:hypothetical protein
MKEGELEERKMAKITDPLGVMHRLSEVERINDGPYLFDLQIVVVEKVQNLLLDLHVVKIKKKCLVVVKIALTKANSELDKVLNLLILTWDLTWEFRNSWDRQTIGKLCNNEVHCSLQQHFA